MRSTRPALGLLVGLFALPHCAAPADAIGTGESDHTATELTFVNSPFAYADADYGEVEPDGDPVLPDDDVVTVRVQAWLDRFHAVAGASVRARTGHDLAAPRPIAKVVNSRESNAWVTPVQGCAKVKLDFTRLPAPDPKAKPAPFVIPAGELLQPLDETTCVTPRNWSPKDAPAFYSSLPQHACSFDVRPDGVAVARPDDCFLLPYVPYADNLVLRASAPFIQITTKLVSLMADERSVAAVLAHELGHYYRAHASTYGSYDYWYEQRTPPVPGKPLPVKDSDALSARFAEVRRAIGLRRFDGEPLAPGIRPDVIAIAEAAASRPAAPSSCKTLERALTEPWANKIELENAVDDAEAKAFVSFEKDFLRCAKEIRVGRVRGRIPSSALGQLARPVPEGTPLIEPVMAASAEMEKLAVEADAFVAEVNGRHLGQYTDEQEADDISMELLASAGLDPREHIDAWVGFTKAMHDDPEDGPFAFAGDPVPFDECQKLFHDGWRRDGQPVYVPMGNLNDTHHGYCYRLFNLSRELLAHAYRPTGASPTTSVPWSAVQARAKEALAAAAGTATPGVPSTKHGLKAIVDRY